MWHAHSCITAIISALGPRRLRRVSGWSRQDSSGAARRRRGAFTACATSRSSTLASHTRQQIGHLTYGSMPEVLCSMRTEPSRE
jgi:hypothetical protein